MVFRVLIFTFCLETTLQEKNQMKSTSVTVIVIFFESIIPKILDHIYVQTLSQQLLGILTTAFERHLTIEDYMDMGVGPAPRHLTYCCILSNKPSF